MSKLRRRRKLILAVVVLVTGLAAVLVGEATPLYRAEAQLIVTGSTPAQRNLEPTNTAGTAPMVSVPGPDFYGNRTEAAVLGSWDLASRVVERLHLESNPLYNAARRGSDSGLLAGWLAPVEHLFDRIGGPGWLRHRRPGAAEPAGVGLPLGPTERAKQRHDAVTAAYLAGLTVLPDERSRVIALRYVSPDPALAALAVNTTAGLYLEQLHARSSGGTGNSSGWPPKGATELADRVKAAERKLEVFERNSAAIPLGSTTLYELQVARLVEQRSELRIHRDEAKARYEQALALVRSPNPAGSESTVLDDARIQGLRQQEAQLQRQLAELKSLYRESHPKVRLATEELDDLHAKIRAEIGRTVQGLGNDYELAKLREAKLNQEIDRLQAMIQEQREASATKAALESELKSSRELYQAMLERLKTAKDDDRAPKGPDARIISQASAPQAPFYPQRGMTMAAAFVISLALGTGLALGIEALDHGFRTRSELEGATAIRVLGIVPLIAAAGKQGGSPHGLALREPNSTYGEAIRALRVALFLAPREGAPSARALLVTSSVPGEGKTSTALAIATTAAQAGHKTILVECDVLRPALAAALACPPGPGLSTFLARQAAIEDVVGIDPQSGLHYIVAGSNVPNASDLLASAALRLLIGALREFYDIVVLDAPPVLAVSDAVAVQRLADRTLFLVRWQRTPRKIVFSALKALLEAGGALAGLVLTQVDVRQHARDEYGRHSESYYAAYRSYHSDAA